MKFREGDLWRCEGCGEDYDIPEEEVWHPRDELAGVNGKLYCPKHFDTAIKELKALIEGAIGILKKGVAQ